MNSNKLIWKLEIGALLAVACLLHLAWGAESPADAGPARSPADGTWKWTLTMPDGTKAEPRAKIKLDGDTLTGTTSLRAGNEAAITNGTLNGDQVSWSVVREHDGRKVTTQYKGKITGDTLTGTIESDWAGEVRRYEWKAKRPPYTPTGTWRMTFGSSGGGRGFGGGGRGGGGGGDSKLVMKQEGEKVTGKMTFFGRESEIVNGKWANGELSFDTVRERDGNKSVTKYWGKLDGDKIIGEVDSETFGVRPWEVTREE